MLYMDGGSKFQYFHILRIPIGEGQKQPLKMSRPRCGCCLFCKGGGMDRRIEAKIQKEIRRRAFQRAHGLRQKRRLKEKTQHTLDALQEVTGLQRPELESIADAVKLSLQGPRDIFFSLKRQILITVGIFISILMLCGLMTFI